jgi:hypothetical protein
LHGVLAGAQSPEPGDQVEARLQAWRKAAAGGDAARFERRLSLEKLNLDAVRAVLTLKGNEARRCQTLTFAGSRLRAHGIFDF